MGVILDKKGVAKIERKSVTIDVKSVSSLIAGQPLIIEGYASTYGSETDLDRDGEFIAAGAFEHPNGLPLYLKNPVILADHENGTYATVGATVEAKTDPIGLWVRVEIPDVPDAAVQTVRQKIAAGILKAFSIGGRFYREWLENAVKIIRVDLWEISIVAVPSRQTALFEPVPHPDLSQPAQRSASGAAAATVDRKTVSSNPQPKDSTPVKTVKVNRKNAAGVVETLDVLENDVLPSDELVQDVPVESDEPTEDEIQAAVAKAAQGLLSKKSKIDAAVAQRLPAYLAGMNQGSKMVHGAQKQIGAPSVIQHRGEKAIGDYDSLIDVLVDLKSGAISTDQKAMTSSSGANAGWLIPDKFLEVDDRREGPRRVQELVTQVPMDGGESIVLTRPSTGLADAAGIAQNTGRGNGDVAYERDTRSLLTLAAPLVKIANQMLRRGGKVGEMKVRREFQRSMTRGRESWIIAGSGAGQNPTGILNETGIGLRGGAALSTAATLIDAVRDAMVVLEVSGYYADGVAMRPELIAAIEKTKDSQGRYLLPGVQRDGEGQLRIWGLPVTGSIGFATNLGAGTNETRVIVGEFGTSEYYRVGGVYVDFSEHFDFGSSNTTFRCEEEATFQCWEHPKAFYVIPAMAALT